MADRRLAVRHRHCGGEHCRRRPRGGGRLGVRRVFGGGGAACVRDLRARAVCAARDGCRLVIRQKVPPSRQVDGHLRGAHAPLCGMFLCHQRRVRRAQYRHGGADVLYLVRGAGGILFCAGSAALCRALRDAQGEEKRPNRARPRGGKTQDLPQLQDRAAHHRGRVHVRRGAVRSFGRREHRGACRAEHAYLYDDHDDLVRGVHLL